MDRARIASLPIPKEATEIKITQRDWGIQRSYKTINGAEICNSIPFNLSNKIRGL